jgi:predicted naringenin-chalcone synthase
LFGDGAGAAVLASEPQSNRRRVEWKFGSSCLVPDKRDTLRFGHKSGMLRNILLPEVPQIVGDEAAKLLAGALASTGVKRDRVAGWIFHTGGRDVLLALPQHRCPARIRQRQQPDRAFCARTGLA